MVINYQPQLVSRISEPSTVLILMLSQVFLGIWLSSYSVKIMYYINKPNGSTSSALLGSFIHKLQRRPVKKQNKGSLLPPPCRASSNTHDLQLSVWRQKFGQTQIWQTLALVNLFFVPSECITGTNRRWSFQPGPQDPKSWGPIPHLRYFKIR